MSRRQAPVRVCFPFTGQVVGGSHLSSLLLVGALPQTEFEPLVVVHAEGPLTDHLEKQGIPYEIVPLRRELRPGWDPWNHLRSVLLTTPRLTRWLRRKGVRIVHTQDARMHMTWAIPARLAGCRFLWHQHSAWLTSRLYGLLLRLAHERIAVSRFVADAYPRSSSPPVPVVLDPYDTSSEPPDRAANRDRLLSKLGCPSDTFLVGFFGNLTQQKRPLVFVDAVAAARRILSMPEDPPLHCAIFGRDQDGLSAEIERRAVERGMGDALHLMGFRSPGEPWIAGCDVIVAPGVNDAYPRVIVEAMLAGTPVIAADSGGNPEIVTDGRTGWLVPVDRPDACAGAIGSVARDPQGARAVARAARQKALERYSIESHVDEIVGIYRSMLRE